MLTDDQLAARTERAVAAATAAGRDLGLTITEPQVLYNVFSVIVHLTPSPVIVRVPTVLPRTTPPPTASVCANSTTACSKSSKPCACSNSSPAWHRPRNCHCSSTV